MFEKIKDFVKANKIKVLTLLGILVAVLAGELTGGYSIINSIAEVFATSQPA